MRENTCCTVSLKGKTTLLRRSHRMMRCEHDQIPPARKVVQSMQEAVQ